MRGFIVRWVMNGLALYFTAHLIEGIDLEGFFASLLAALVLGLVNAIIRPIISILTLPLNILTLGLFTFVINGFMLWVVSTTMTGFYVENVFFVGILGAIVMSIISGILTFLIKDSRL
ncbi:MAG: phage holin family protein [Candidatus Syntrophonatronum acetioxidans]|uniref:Phage holin family protein n=1 Tax=Candidatus Syntrophonatronum acetioxidans TaxID=1795816 RepID=A0A424YE38_9FIRM|nr:MAG: phage holin family protein [Candidatus Syntrophonatronum acetioxidans]